jgi:hypothetical protein
LLPPRVDTLADDPLADDPLLAGESAEESVLVSNASLGASEPSQRKSALD